MDKADDGTREMIRLRNDVGNTIKADERMAIMVAAVVIHGQNC